MFDFIKHIIRESVQLYRNHTKIVLGYAAWLFLPAAISIVTNSSFTQFIEAHILAEETAKAQALGIVHALIQLILFVFQIWFAIAFAKTVALLRKGQTISRIVPELKLALPLVPRTVLLWFMLSLVMGIGLILPIYMQNTVGLVLGLGLLVVGIYFVVRFVYSVSIIALEGERIKSALQKSNAMVHGRWWYTLMIIVLPLIFFSVVNYLAVIIVQAPLQFISLNDIEISGLALSFATIISVLSTIVDALFAPALIAAPTITYLEMKQQ